MEEELALRHVQFVRNKALEVGFVTIEFKWKYSMPIFKKLLVGK